MKPMKLITEVDDDEEQSPMQDSEVLAFCQQEVARGLGGDTQNSEDSNISTPLDYYHGRLPGLSPAEARDPKASRFVSLDIMDAVEATVAEIFPTFTTEEIAFFNPDSDRDEEQAQNESDLVNYMLFDESDGYNILQSALRDCLLHRNASVKCYWDERTTVEYEEYEDVTEMALFEILQPTAPNQTVEVVAQFECAGDPESDELPNTIQINKESVTLSLMDQVIEGEMSDATYDIKVKRMTVVGKPVIDALPPEQVIVSGDHDVPTLYNARFVAHEKIETQSSLIEQGFDPEVVDRLEDYQSGSQSESRSRTANENNYFSSDRSVRNIRVYECYALLDVDGDGIAERRKIVYSGGNLLANDPWNSVSIVGGVTTAMAHKYKGLSLFDRLKEIQDSKTPVIRSIIDGTRLSANPRIGVVTGEVNIDDLLTSKVGGVVRADNPTSIFSIPSAEVPQSAYSMLGFMDGMRRERGGSAIDTASQASKLSNESAHSFERSMSAMELNNALLARTFGETLIRGIFVEMHNIIRENYEGDINVKIRGNWIQSVPSSWKKRTNITVSIGASNAERLRQAQMMQQVIGFQQQLAGQGSTMVDEKKIYNSIRTAVSLSGIKNPESYFISPESPEGQKASSAKAQQGAEAKAKQDQLDAAMAKAQTDLAMAEQMKGQAALDSQKIKFENDKIKAELDLMKTQVKDIQESADLTYKYEQLSIDEAIAMSKIEADKQIALAKINATMKCKMDMDMMKKMDMGKMDMNEMDMMNMKDKPEE